MVIRTLAIILAVVLAPGLAMAQRGGRGGGGFSGARGGSARGGSAHGAAPAQARGAGAGQAAPAMRPGFGSGIPTGGLGANPGFGNVNHPGLGFVPSAPGIGFPLNPGNHIIIRSPIRRDGAVINSPFRHHDGFNRFNRGNTVILGVPWGMPWGGYYPYFYGSDVYSSTMVDAYGNPVAPAPAAPAAPNIIIIEPGAGQVANEAQYGQSVGTWAGPSNFDPRNSVTVYRATPSDVPDKPAKPLTLLVFNDHSIYAVTDYWKEGNRVCYTTNYGSQNCVAQDQLDLQFTKKLNAERNIPFELP